MEYFLWSTLVIYQLCFFKRKGDLSFSRGNSHFAEERRHEDR